MYWVRTIDVAGHGIYTYLLCDSFEEFVKDIAGAAGAPCVWDAQVGKLKRLEARKNAKTTFEQPDFTKNPDLSPNVKSVMNELGAVVSATVIQNLYGTGPEEGMREIRELVINKKDGEDFYIATAYMPGYESIFDGTINKTQQVDKSDSFYADYAGDYAIAYCDIASAYHENHDYKAAIDCYSEAIKIAPDYISAYYNRGGHYFLISDFENAVKDLTRCLKIEPSFDNAKELLERITNSKLRKELRKNFDHLKWRDAFRIASEKASGFRELRADIFQGTLNFVRADGYDWEGVHVKINNGNIITEFFDAPDKLTADNTYDTKFAVVYVDCLEAAQLLLAAGLNPCVLNMANRQNPGGGVISGSGAQEENIFRRTNLFMSLFQFAPYANEYGVKKSGKSYPLNRNTGGIYSGNITVFRGSEKNGYCLLKHPFTTAVVTAPAINRPELVKKTACIT